MPNALTQAIAFLLLPCLIVDLRCGMGLSHDPTTQVKSKQPISLVDSRLESEALGNIVQFMLRPWNGAGLAVRRSATILLRQADPRFRGIAANMARNRSEVP